MGGGFFSGAAGAVGGIFKAALPVLLPPLIGLGANWVAGQIGGQRQPPQQAVPEPVKSTVDEVNSQRAAESSAVSIGTVVIAAAVLALLMR